ncbi:hypothetical protein HYW74_02865 [Candidatus Pacearchaeota archaeon]|nr:hypothetical protein [Candidatus Pacearchaeota archaeon]
MDKLKARYHSPVVIIGSQTSDNLFMSRYDDGYPFNLYRGAFNPFGGNPTVKERERGLGPLETLSREIEEEIDPAASIDSNWLPQEKILTLQKSVLKGLIPVVDLYVNAPQVEGGRPVHQFIYSVFQTSIPEGNIEIARQGIEEGKKIITEGFPGITTLDDLRQGKDRLAHSSALIFKHVFNDKKGFPCLIPGATATPIGMPRKSYRDYAEIDYDTKAFRE